MGVVLTKSSWSPTALNVLFTTTPDTTGPSVVKFSLDSTWLPAGTIANVSVQTLLSSSASTYKETQNASIANPIDLYQSTTGGAMTSGSNALTVTAFPTELSVGDEVVVMGAGASGGNLYATVTAVNSTTSYTLSANAGTTVSSATVYAGVAINYLGYEPLWESDTIANPYGIRLQCQLVQGTVFPPLPLNIFELAAS